MFAVIRAAEQGLGLALVPEAMIGSLIEKGSLEMFTEETNYF